MKGKLGTHSDMRTNKAQKVGSRFENGNTGAVRIIYCAHHWVGTREGW